MPQCAGCGVSFDDTFKFCPQCGRAAPEPQKVIVEVRGPEHQFDCPLCGDASAIQKVSAIVEGGTSVSRGSTTSNGESRIYSEQTGDYIGNARSSATTTSYQTSQSNLARKLALPTAPVEPNHTSFEFFPPGWMMIPLYILGLFVGWPIAEVIAGEDSLPTTLLGLFCLGPLAGGIAGFLLMMIVNNLNGSKEKYQNALKDYQDNLRVYNLLLTQWNELYYCHKHDVVYTLSRRQPVPADEAINHCIRWGMEAGKE